MTATAVATAVPRAPRRGRMWLAGWAALVQLVLDVALAVPYLLLVVVLVVGLGLVPVFGVGLVPVALTLLAARGLAVLERARVLAFVEDYVPPPPPLRPDQPWWRWLLLDTRPWKAVVHLIAMALWGMTGAFAVLVVLCSGIALALVPTYQRALPDGRLDLFGVAHVPAGWWWGVVGLLTVLVLPFAAIVFVRVDVALARALLGPPRAQREEVMRQRV
jgi:hypothetical protein